MDRKILEYDLAIKVIFGFIWLDFADNIVPHFLSFIMPLFFCKGVPETL